MNHQQYVERTLWELHKSPRNHVIDYVLGSPRDDRIFDTMVENGTIVRDFRLRGFPNRSMEKPTIPITVPREKNRNRMEQASAEVWVRNYRPNADAKQRMDSLVYGEGFIDNSPRRRGLRPFPIDPGPDTARSNYQRLKEDEEMDDIERYKRELMRDRALEDQERKQVRSPQRDSRQGRRNKQNSYYPEDSQYEPSFGHGNARQTTREYYSSHREIISPGRETWGIPVTDFIKHDEFEDQHFNAGTVRSPPKDPRGIPVMDFLNKHDEIGSDHLNHLQSNRDFPDNREGTNSPRRGIPVTDFIKHDEFDGEGVHHGHSGLNLESNRGDERSPRWGIPVTDFIKREDLEGMSGGKNTRGRVHRLPDEPVYDPFGRAGGGAPIVDSTGRRRTTVFGNFEKKGEPRDVEKDVAAKNRMKEELFRGMEEQRIKRSRDLQYQRRLDSDLADLMRGKEVGRPRVNPSAGTPSHLQLPPVSDVSRTKLNHQPRDGREAGEYRRFLQGQMEERERSRQRDKQRQRFEADQHFATFDSQWGHLGGGAPKDGKEHRKVKLEDAIHRHSDSQYETNAPYATGYSYGI